MQIMSVEYAKQGMRRPDDFAEKELELRRKLIDQLNAIKRNDPDVTQISIYLFEPEYWGSQYSIEKQLVWLQKALQENCFLTEICFCRKTAAEELKQVSWQYAEFILRENKSISVIEEQWFFTSDGLLPETQAFRDTEFAQAKLRERLAEFAQQPIEIRAVAFYKQVQAQYHRLVAEALKEGSSDSLAYFQAHNAWGQLREAFECEQDALRLAISDLETKCQQVVMQSVSMDESVVSIKTRQAAVVSELREITAASSALGAKIELRQFCELMFEQWSASQQKMFFQLAVNYSRYFGGGGTSYSIDVNQYLRTGPQHLALFVAAQHLQLEVVKGLLRLGADPFLPAQLGHSCSVVDAVLRFPADERCERLVADILFALYQRSLLQFNMQSKVIRLSALRVDLASFKRTLDAFVSQYAQVAALPFGEVKKLLKCYGDFYKLLMVVETKFPLALALMQMKWWCRFYKIDMYRPLGAAFEPLKQAHARLPVDEKPLGLLTALFGRRKRPSSQELEPFPLLDAPSHSSDLAIPNPV